MSKRVILYRHAKSDWGADYGSDHERPLAKKGVKSAKIMGKVLANSNQLPQLVITSTAVRARETLKISMSEGSWDCDVEENKGLYDDDVDEIFEIVKSISNKVSNVMLVGHEPKTSTLCNMMIGGGNAVFPTAAMARIDFAPDDWSSLEFGKGQLRWLLQPSFFVKANFKF